MSGGWEVAGNKLRKLEYLVHDALAKDADAVITIGGIQSNHCRATAAAAASAGLACHLILRTPVLPVSKEQDMMCGNLMVDRIVGAHVHLVSQKQYSELGSERLCRILAEKLIGNGVSKNPYIIPVGGSNWIGSQGFRDAVDELRVQIDEMKIALTDIAVACGSGGTVAGLVEGLRNSMSLEHVKLTAYSVCDTPEYFYEFIEKNILPTDHTRRPIRELLTVKCAKGNGYAVSTKEELEFIADFARKTGIVLDPVYTGKAFFSLVKDLLEDSDGDPKTVLFWHTGGSLGIYAQRSQLEQVVQDPPITELLD
jgi:D-cysteine desulfhydrase family pyridoxal phosphate-dependent enzyme